MIAINVMYRGFGRWRRVRYVCECGTTTHWWPLRGLARIGETEDTWFTWWVDLHISVSHPDVELDVNP